MKDPRFSRAWWRKKLFSLFGKVVRSPKGASPPLPKNPRRILVLAPVLRGDYIVISPLLSGLAMARPRAEIGVVVTKASLDLAQADPIVHHVILYRKLPGWPKSILEVFNYKPDIVVLPKAHPAFTESMLLMVSRAPFRVGLSHINHNALLTHRIPHAFEKEHRSEANSRLLEPFGLDSATVNRRPHIGKDEDAEIRAEKFFEDWDGDNPWISINVSAGSPVRIWPASYWKELIALIHDSRPEFNFLVLGSPEDRDICEEVAAKADYIRTVQTKSFLDATALMFHTRMLISPDTGSVHAAAARGIPVVVLYNSDRVNYIRFAPQSIPHRAIFPETGHDVNNIAPVTVFNEVVVLLSEIDL